MVGAMTLLLGCATATAAHGFEKPDSLNGAGSLAGRHSFQRRGQNLVNIINHTTILAAGALSTRGVLSQETITARLETVHLSAGDLLTLDLSGDGLIRFTVGAATVQHALGADGQPLASRVENEGISANGEEVTLTARAVKDVLTQVVTRGGVARLIGEDETPEVATELALLNR
jgi:hypothetical protein